MKVTKVTAIGKRTEMYGGRIYREEENPELLDIEVEEGDPSRKEQIKLNRLRKQSTCQK